MNNNTKKKYMSFLDIETKNNKLNYDANKHNKIGIQKPPEMTDTRSTQQKLSNIHQLKADLFREFSPTILDGQQYQIAMNLLTEDEIIFITQYSGYIISQLKPRCSMGMLADQFVNYVRRFKLKEESTSGVDFPIQEDIGTKILESLQSIKKKHEELEIQKIQKGMKILDSVQNIRKKLSDHDSKITDENLEEQGDFYRSICQEYMSLDIDNYKKELGNECAKTTATNATKATVPLSKEELRNARLKFLEK